MHFFKTQKAHLDLKLYMTSSFYLISSSRIILSFPVWWLGRLKIFKNVESNKQFKLNKKLPSNMQNYPY